MIKTVLRVSLLLVLFLDVLFPTFAFAQDVQPSKIKAEKQLTKINPPNFVSQIYDTITIDKSVPVPKFATKANEIENNVEVLYGVLEKMRKARYGLLQDSLRIVHIGDSHVRGHIFPQTVSDLLKKEFGAVSYTDIGVNGAICTTFVTDELIGKIRKADPELLILSFGTNESHNIKYNDLIHYNQINELVESLRAYFPNTPIILTTPPGSYQSFKRRRRARVYSVNPRTSKAAKTIKKYTEQNNLLLWDLYNIAGGEKASNNWYKAKLMRGDRIHYLPDGYILQGNMLFQAIIKAYNSYVNL